MSKLRSLTVMQVYAELSSTQVYMRWGMNTSNSQILQFLRQIVRYRSKEELLKIFLYFGRTKVTSKNFRFPRRNLKDLYISTSNIQIPTNISVPRKNPQRSICTFQNDHYVFRKYTTQVTINTAGPFESFAPFDPFSQPMHK